MAAVLCSAWEALGVFPEWAGQEENLQRSALPVKPCGRCQAIKKRSEVKSGQLNRMSSTHGHAEE